MFAIALEVEHLHGGNNADETGSERQSARSDGRRLQDDILLRREGSGWPEDRRERQTPQTGKETVAEESRLERHHRDPASLETKVEVGEGCETG